MKIFKYKIVTSILLLTLLVFKIGCIEEPDLWKPSSNELQITEYVIANDSVYSEFKKIMDLGKMSSLLSTRGPFTLFLPDNNAMDAYYKKLGISSVEELDSVYLRKLVLNHVTPGLVYSTDVPLGRLPQPNGLGDYLVTEFLESDIIINKQSILTDRDILTANGIIHRINKVIDMVTDNTLDVLKKDNTFSIFVEGLNRAGISDTLTTISIPYGRKEARVRYTILVVPDSVYAKENIHSINDLIARFDDGIGNLSNHQNGFYKYMEYHCIEGALFTSDFKSTVYPIISRENVVNMNVDSDFKINYNKATKEYTGFIIAGCNIPAKNGVIHSVNGILEDIEPIPAPYRFQVTDFPDFRSLDCYHKIIKNFFDGENSFEKVKWKTADYLQYYYKTSEGTLLDYDCIVMSEGFWELEVTIPKIRKGKYNIKGHFKKGWNRANVAVYIDGKKIDQILEMNFENLVYEKMNITDVDWQTTTEHTFRLKTVYPGIIMWDYLEFTPIKEQ